MSALTFGKYRHYKGHDYELVGIGRREGTLEEMAIYKLLYNAPDFPIGTIFIRPLSEFVEIVEWEGKQVPRFTFIG